MNAAYVMAVNINRAFKRYGWCTRIMDSTRAQRSNCLFIKDRLDDGAVAVGPTEIAIDDRREAELATAGLLGPPSAEERRRCRVHVGGMPSEAGHVGRPESRHHGANRLRSCRSCSRRAVSRIT